MKAKVLFALTLILSTTFLTLHAQDWNEIIEATASDAASGDLFGYSVAIDADYAIVGARTDDDAGNSSGSAYIFVRSGGNWIEQAKLTASDATASDNFGESVSISGDYAIVGATRNDDNGFDSGSAYIFVRSGTNWTEQAKLTALDAAGGDEFGYSVDIGGDYAIVGARLNGDDGVNSGSAYIFVRSGTNWSEQTKLTASDAAANDLFGASVAIDGDYAIVGAYGNDDEGDFSGSAYIFERTATNWIEQAKLTASDATAIDLFGYSVAIDGDYAIVGAYGDDDAGSASGSAYIFLRSGTNWAEQIKLTAFDAAANDYFGWSVSIEGDYAVVGAHFDGDAGPNSGSAYIFMNTGTTWMEQTKLIASDASANAQFGQSVALDGNYAVIGAPLGDGAVSDSGSVYFFEQTVAPPPAPQDWNEIIEATASDGATSDAFGYSVAIDGDYAIVGARSNDDDGTNSGSAYIFVRSGGNWTEQAKLTASDAAPGDQFGHSVSISGDYAIVGAYLDDDDGSSSGSAYIFERSGTNWAEQAKLTASDAATSDFFGHSVSISGDYAIVGAYSDDDVAIDSGSAYVFMNTGVTWMEQTKLTASDASVNARFGWSVALDGNYAIVGAYWDGFSSGSAYIFERSGTNWAEQAKLTASDAAANDLFGYSVSISGDYAIVGAYFDDDDGFSSGSAYIFERSGTNWAEQAKLTASDAAASDLFGYSVSISVDYAIVGAYADDDVAIDSGSAYVFINTGGTWMEQTKLTASTASDNARFGGSVALDGNYAVIGAPFGDGAVSGSGSAYFFEQTVAPPPAPQDWNEIIEATASDAAPSDAFGYSVAIDGDYAIVGDYRKFGPPLNSGAAYIFVRSGGNWTEQAKLTASDAASDDSFGHSVSISGDYAIVGAYRNDDAGNSSGSAYIFVRSGTNWTEQVKLTASDASASDQFGWSVAINGDYTIVGASGDLFSSGSAYIFERSDGNWTEQAKLTSSDAITNDQFGYSVSLDGNYAIVGANADNNASGSAYIYERVGTSWTEQSKITASDAEASDFFGVSVDIVGNYAIVGAYLDRNAGSVTGSAYIFQRSGASWTEQVKLIASDAAANDLFGNSVSIDGDYAIVGAFDNDDAGSSSGSAYIFIRTGETWMEQTKLTASDAEPSDSFGYSVALDGNYAIVGAPVGFGAGSVYFFGPDIPAITFTFNSSWLPSDPNGIATAFDDIIVETGNAILSSATIANTVTIEPGASLTVDVALTATEITLNSTSTTYASLVTGTSGNAIGTITYNRFVNSNILGNDLISPPLAGQTWTSFLDPVNATALLSNPGLPTVYAFAPFDKTTGDFENYDFNTTATLTSGTGYRAATNTGETLGFTGTVPANVNVNIVDSNTNFSEWNLVGNPYPAYLNVQAFLNHQVDTGVSNLNLLAEETTAIYGYDGNAQNGWTIYNLANTNASTVMAPGQGFFVAADATNVSAYDLEFTPNMQATGTSDDFILGRNAELIYLTLDLSSNTNAYTTDFYFNPNASEGLDRGYDAAFWGADIPEFSIYSHLVEDNQGKPIALQSLNSTELSNVTIPLGVNANQGEQITIGILEGNLPESVNVYLDDTVSNTLTLLNDSDYVISPETDLFGTGRFFLKFSSVVLSTLEPNLDTLNIYVLDSSKELIVRGELEENTRLNLYDIQGRKVLSKQLESSQIENRIDVSALSGGVYVVNLQNATGQKSQKVILK